MILISFCFDVQKIVSRASNVCMKFIFLGLASVSPQLKTKQKYITPTWSNLYVLFILKPYSSVSGIAYPGGVLKKWYSTTIFHEKGTPFVYLLLTNGTPFTYLV